MSEPAADDGGAVPSPRNERRPAGEGTRPPSDDATGLPWPRAWRGVYVLVAGVFVLWLVLLTALTKMFS